jgi:hypothetical protein
MKNFNHNEFQLGWYFVLRHHKRSSMTIRGSTTTGKLGLLHVLLSGSPDKKALRDGKVKVLVKVYVYEHQAAELTRRRLFA